MEVLKRVWKYIALGIGIAIALVFLKPRERDPVPQQSAIRPDQQKALDTNIQNIEDLQQQAVDAVKPAPKTQAKSIEEAIENWKNV